jgi:hypothetical protein
MNLARMRSVCQCAKVCEKVRVVETMWIVWGCRTPNTSPRWVVMAVALSKFLLRVTFTWQGDWITVTLLHKVTELAHAFCRHRAGGRHCFFPGLGGVSARFRWRPNLATTPVCVFRYICTDIYMYNLHIYIHKYTHTHTHTHDLDARRRVART